MRSGNRRTIIQHLITGCFLANALLHFATLVAPNQALRSMTGVIAALTVLVIIPLSKGIDRYFLIGFTLLGTGLLYGKADLHTWLASFASFVDFVTLVILIRVFRLPFESGGYSEAIAKVALRLVRSVSSLYLMVFGLSSVLASFTLFSSVPLTYYSVQTATAHLAEKRARFTATAITRGYANSLFWSPMSSTMAVSLKVAGSSWLAVLPYSIPFIVLSIVLTALLSRVETYGSAGRAQAPVTASASDQAMPAGTWRQVTEFLALCMLLLVLYMLVNYFTNLKGLDIVSMTAILFLGLWTAVKKKAGIVREGLKRYLVDEVKEQHAQWALFLTIGFMGSVLGSSGYMSVLHDGLNRLGQVIGSQNVIAVLPVIVLVFAFAGINPVVTIAIIGTSLGVDVLSLRPELVAVLLITLATMSYIVSPFSIMNLLVTNLVGENNFKMVRWNGVYMVLFLVLSLPLILFIQNRF